MKIQVVVDAQHHSFLASALDGGKWLASCSCRLYSNGKSPPRGNHWRGAPVWTFRWTENILPLLRFDTPFFRCFSRYPGSWRSVAWQKFTKSFGKNEPKILWRQREKKIRSKCWKPSTRLHGATAMLMTQCVHLYIYGICTELVPVLYTCQELGEFVKELWTRGSQEASHLSTL